MTSTRAAFLTALCSLLLLAPRVEAATRMSALVEQWTDAHGADQAADVGDTVGGYPHQEFYGADGGAVVETYSLPVRARPPVDPCSGAEQCGTAGAYLLDADLCVDRRLGTACGLGRALYAAAEGPCRGAAVGGTVPRAVCRRGRLSGILPA